MGIETGIWIAISLAGLAAGGVSYILASGRDEAKEEDTLYSWSGPKTVAKEGTPVYIIYGTCPSYGNIVNLYIETVSDNGQRLNMMLAVCEGPVDEVVRNGSNGFTEVKINDQLSTDFLPEVGTEVASGTTGAGSTTTVIKDSGLFLYADTYLDRILTYDTGTVNAGESRVIRNVDPVNRQVTVSPAFSGTPDTGDTFTINDFCAVRNGLTKVEHWFRTSQLIARGAGTSMHEMSWGERGVDETECIFQAAQDVGTDSDDGIYECEAFNAAGLPYGWFGQQQVIYGTTQAGSTTTSIKDTSLFGYDDHFNGFTLKWRPGTTNANQSRVIRDTDGTNGTVTIDALANAPGVGDVFDILAPEGFYVVREELNLGEAYAGTTNELAGYTIWPDGKLDYRFGTEDQTAITGFDQLHNTTAVGKDLNDLDDYWEYTTSLSTVDHLRLGFTLRCSDIKEEVVGWEDVTYKIQWKRATGDSYDTTRQKIVTKGARTTQPILKVTKITAAELASGATQYKIKVTRMTDKSDSKHTRELSWSWVDEVEDRGLVYPYTALVALRSLASEKLSGSVPDIRCVVRRKIRDYRAPDTGAQDGAAADAVTVTDNSLFTTDDAYNDWWITFLTGSLALQSRQVSATNGTAHTVTVAVAFTGNPGNGDTFEISKHRGMLLSGDEPEVSTPAYVLLDMITNRRYGAGNQLGLQWGACDAASTIRTIVDSRLFLRDDEFNDNLIVFTSGNNNDRASRIVDTDRATNSVTISPVLSSEPEVPVGPNAVDAGSSQFELLDTVFGTADQYNNWRVIVTYNDGSTPATHEARVIDTLATGSIRVTPTLDRAPTAGVTTYTLYPAFEIIKDIAISDFQTVGEYQNTLIDSNGDSVVDERRHRCEVIYETQSSMVQRLKEFLLSYGMMALWQDGKVRLRQDMAQSSVMALDTTEPDEGGADNVKEASIKVQYNDLLTTPNVLLARYANREDAYQATPTGAYDHTALMTDETMEERTREVTLLGITRPSEARRRVVQLINMARLQKITVNLDAKAGAIAAEVGDVITLTDAETGFTAKEFMLYETGLAEDGERQGVILGEYYAGMYSYEGLTVVEDDRINLPDPAQPPSPVTNLKATFQTNGLHITFDIPQDTMAMWRNAIVKISEDVAGPYIVIGKPTTGSIWYHGVYPGMTYYIEVWSESKWNVRSNTAARTVITVGGDDGSEIPGWDLPAVSGLEIDGQGDDTGFIGGAVRFAWNPLDLQGGSDSAGEGALIANDFSGSSSGQTELSYVVKVTDTSNNVQRTELVYTTYWEYRPEDAKADFAGTIPQEFCVFVWAVDKSGRVSARPAHIRVLHDGSKLPVVTGVDVEAGFRKLLINWDQDPLPFVKYDLHVFGRVTGAETTFTPIAKVDTNSGRTEGYVVSGTATSITDTGRTEAVDYWKGAIMHIRMTVSGTTKWYRRVVTAFASGVFTLAPALPAAPAGGEPYQVGTFKGTTEGTVAEFKGPQNRDYLVQVYSRDDYGVADTGSTVVLFDQIGDQLAMTPVAARVDTTLDLPNGMDIGIGVDSDRALHVVGCFLAGADIDWGLYAPGGVATAMSAKFTTVSGSGAQSADVAIDGADGVHVVWADAGKIYYGRLTKAGVVECARTEMFSNAVYAKVAYSASDNKLYWAWLYNNRYYFAHTTIGDGAGGSAPAVEVAGTVVTSASIDADAMFDLVAGGGKAHFVFGASDDKIYYARCASDGTVEDSGSEAFTEGTTYTNVISGLYSSLVTGHSHWFIGNADYASGGSGDVFHGVLDDAGQPMSYLMPVVFDQRADFFPVAVAIDSGNRIYLLMSNSGDLELMVYILSKPEKSMVESWTLY